MDGIELNSLCLKWQKRLRVQDWNVKISLVKADETSEWGRAGECSWVLEKKSAVINIVDPACWGNERAESVEKILVHELLHLHFAPFFNDSQEVLMEQAIDLIAEAFFE